MKKEISQNHFLLMLLLALVVLVESVWIVGSLQKSTSLPTAPTMLQKIIPQTKKGIISLSLKEGQKVSVGQNLSAQISFNSPEEAAAGADIILTFDPQMISVTNIVGNKTVFEEIIANTQKQTTGKIKITAYSPTQTLLGEQILATLTIRLLKNQPATLGLEFLGPDVVTDCNLVAQKTHKDILGKVQTLRLIP